MEVDDIRKSDEILETFHFSEGMQIPEDVISHVREGQEGSRNAFPEEVAHVPDEAAWLPSIKEEEEDDGIERASIDPDDSLFGENALPEGFRDEGDEEEKSVTECAEPVSLSPDREREMASYTCLNRKARRQKMCTLREKRRQEAEKAAAERLNRALSVVFNVQQAAKAKELLQHEENAAKGHLTATLYQMKRSVWEWVLVKMRVADATNLKAMNKDALESSMKVEVMNKQAYDKLIVQSRKMKKGGEINEKAHIGMMEVKEACDEMVEGVLMPMLQIPLDEVFSKSRREYMMMQKGMEYREYTWRLTNKVRSEGAAYIDAHLAIEHIAAKVGAQVDVASEMLCSVAEMVKEHGVMKIHGRVVRLQEEMKKTRGRGVSGPVGGKHSMYPTCDIQSGGITVEDVDVDGPGVTEKRIPNTGVDVR
uniref:Uncharacterized protein n=1 Tax=Chromera velia CCMP2878 TaxID=1169474 RepID=A0A0G4HXC8_9ALVE|eukprot:Cvel_9244.t1-p1 / transcript=Cvel_9244.t1 / gene=Cvel_9244 / organism=Chromera_velia_CCMP2878 / gene_product=hypothetical protein / transcript_product=hypothetical protein / location=Cvel_scaffold528:24752-27517(-) / protein_length=422 / sequence_SO=supercontig / SO=protein_coding / is_pseudo=false